MRALPAFIVLVAGSLAGCTAVVQLRNAKTGETATCGGEMRSLRSSAQDEHCLKYFHQLDFEPVP